MWFIMICARVDKMWSQVKFMSHQECKECQVGIYAFTSIDPGCAETTVHCGAVDKLIF